MTSRFFDFEPDAKCDQCGAIGATDFYGDYICDACFEKNMREKIGMDEDEGISED